MPAGTDEPLWLTKARRDLAAGVKEVPGKAAHPRIIEMYDHAGLAHTGDDDQSWCGCACGTWLKEAEYPTPPNFYGAKQFESYGVKVAAADWRPGDIVVLYRTKLREKDWRRHVGLLVGETKSHWKVLGGNQGNAVSIANFPKADTSAIRRPVAPTPQALAAAGDEDMKIATALKQTAVTAVGTGAAGSIAAEMTRAPVAPPPVDLAVDIKGLTDWFGIYSKLLEGGNGLAKLIGAHPWLAAALVGGSAIWWLASWLTKRRIERAQQGIGSVGAG
jgi:uncharacterized protein (TIGR02594 family)